MKALPAVPFEAVLSVNQKREKSATLSTQSISATFIKSKAKGDRVLHNFILFYFHPRAIASSNIAQ